MLRRRNFHIVLKDTDLCASNLNLHLKPILQHLRWSPSEILPSNSPCARRQGPQVPRCEPRPLVGASFKRTCLSMLIDLGWSREVAQEDAPPTRPFDQRPHSSIPPTHAAPFPPKKEIHERETRGNNPDGFHRANPRTVCGDTRAGHAGARTRPILRRAHPTTHPTSLFNRFCRTQTTLPFWSQPWLLQCRFGQAKREWKQPQPVEIDRSVCSRRHTPYEPTATRRESVARSYHPGARNLLKWF